MAFKINTSRLNDVIAMLRNFYMQNKLYEMSSQRQMGYLSEQDRLIRERQAAEDVRSRQGRFEQHALNINEAVEKGLIDATKDPGAKGLKRQIDILERAGRTNEAEPLKEKYGQVVENFIMAYGPTQEGKIVDREGLRAMIEAGGLDVTTKATEESTRTRQFGQRLPIEQQEAITSRGRLALEREKFEAEKGPGGRKIDTKLYDTITDVLNYLEPVARDEIHIYREPAQYLSGQLAKIQMKVGAGEEITPDDRGIISEARELKKMAGKYLGKTLPGQERYLQGKEEERKADEALTEQTKASLIRPGAQVPAPATVPTIRKYIKDLRTGEEYWIILRNGQWMRE